MVSIFPLPPSLRRLPKDDRWVALLVIFAGLGYAFSSTIGYNMFGERAPEAVAVLVVIFAASRVLLSRQQPQGSGARGTIVLAIFALVAVINCAISWYVVETMLRWTLWFILVILLTKAARSTKGDWMEAAIQWLPFLFFGTYISIMLFARGLINPVTGLDQSGVRSLMHLTGLVGNLILATGLFAPRLWHRMLWSLIGFYVIFRSGAGGALFTIPISFLPFILYSTTSVPIKGMTVALLLFTGAVVFYNSELFTRFLDIKVGGDPTEALSGRDRLENSGKTRILLVQMGWEISKQNPLGTGLGDTYYNLILDQVGMAHAHNGTISLLIEFGYPGFAAYVGVLLWVLLSILTNPAIEKRKKAFYFTYYFTIFGRSLSENYTPFDLGNFYNMIFLLFTGYLFLCPRIKPVRLPAPGALGLSPPSMRPPIPLPPGRAPFPLPPGRAPFPPPPGPFPPPRSRQPWGPPVSAR